MTEETKKDKMSYSAMAGELRKGARLYEVFKNASDAATILASFEKEEEATKRRISLLTKELAGLDAECDTAYANKSSAEEAEKASKVNAGGIVQRAHKEAERITKKAAGKAAQLKEEANATLEGIKSQITKAEADMVNSISKKNAADSALSKVEKQVQAAKDKFLKTLEV